MPSVGLFFSSLTVTSFFGTPVSGIYQARFMDIQQSLIGAASQDRTKTIAFLKHVGMIGSLLEGAVFDQLEGRTLPAIEGISAVQLLSDAVDLNIPVYRITPQNKDAILPLLALSTAIERDIDNTVRQGKTVIAPESNPTNGLWSGAGYIIQDETTGAGAYRISGGLNGGLLVNCAGELVPIFIKGVLIVVAIALLFYIVAAILAGFAPVFIFLAATAGNSAMSLVSSSATADTFSHFLLIRQVTGLATIMPVAP
jgi:hypothetical protein